MSAVETLAVPATLAGVRQGLDAFEHFGRSHHLSRASEWRVLLALDEILSNIVRHGHPVSEAAIDLVFTIDNGRVGVEVVDDCAPFDPLSVPAPDTSGPLETRRPGGLGVALVRELMDDARYERRDNRNYFVMRCGPHEDR